MSWCDSWAKDMQRCCSLSCGTDYLSEEACGTLGTSGSCVYPHAGSSRCATNNEQRAFEPSENALPYVYTALAGGCRTDDGGLGDYSVQNGLDQAGCQSACTSDLACVAYEPSLVSSGTRCELHTRAISYGSGQGAATCYVKQSPESK